MGVEDYLNHTLEVNLAKNMILPTLFHAIKKEENGSLSGLLEDLKNNGQRTMDNILSMELNKSSK